MKKIISLLVPFLVFSTTALANDISPCNDSVKLQSALLAAQQLQQKNQLYPIPGLVSMEVTNCSEIEAVNATAENWVCGVMLWFNDRGAREVFQSASYAFGGFINVPGQSIISVPLCTRTVSNPSY